MMDAETIVKLGIKAGFDEVVADTYLSRRSYLKIANSKVDSIVTKFENSGSLFVSSKKRIFFTNIDRLEKKEVDAAIARSKKVIQMVQPKEDYFGLAEGPFKYKKASAPDKKIESISNEGIADIAYAAINGASGGGATNVAGTVFVRYSENELATSKSVHANGAGSEVRLSIRTFRGSNFSAQDVNTSQKLSGLNPEKLGNETAMIASRANRTGRIESGIYDLVYAQSPGGSLVYMTNAMACIGNVETGSSWFTGKLNKPVASPDINIYDDGNMDGAIAASPYDDEGYPTQKTALIKNGKLLSYLHNYSTAKKYKTKSTGNAGLVEPGANTMLFEHKKKVKDIDALIERLEKGIVITNTWYTRFSNYLTGDFSTVPRDIALYVENGEVKFAIKQRDVGSMVGIRITDNMVRMLKNTECAARDTKQASNWDTEGDYFFMPSILVRGATVSVA
ncbi:MAG: TldD/PmbA family protein [Candidatus Micrarchaeota archaeon]|nr:TldD/PmbA family protein [Candidatus Micrarchaeota archaeon]